MLARTVSAIFLCWILPLQAAPLEQALDSAAKAQRSGARTQEQIDQLDEQTRKLLSEWRHAQRKVDELGQYRQQLQAQTEAQAAQLDDMEASLGEIASLERQIVPLMLEMAATLREFVRLDLPFQLEERNQRLDRLDAALARPDLDNGEKFRRLMETWGIESEYGRTLEAWPGEVELAGAPLQVQFLRLGRVSLLFQTLDGERGGIWNGTAQAWQALDAGQLPELRKAIQVAREERAPGLLLLPVPAPREAAR